MSSPKVRLRGLILMLVFGGAMAFTAIAVLVQAY